MDEAIKQESQIKLRLTSDMKVWLKHQAIENCRTLTREIEHRIMESRKRQEAESKSAQQ